MRWTLSPSMPIPKVGPATKKGRRATTSSRPEQTTNSGSPVHSFSTVAGVMQCFGVRFEALPRRRPNYSASVRPPATVFLARGWCRTLGRDSEGYLTLSMERHEVKRASIRVINDVEPYVFFCALPDYFVIHVSSPRGRYHQPKPLTSPRRYVRCPTCSSPSGSGARTLPRRGSPRAPASINWAAFPRANDARTTTKTETP